MANTTKMIIITADENVIRQLLSNKSPNTQIIDLDANSQSILTNNNNDDIINLPLLAELSKPNTTNDQVSKRALDSTDLESQKLVKTSRKQNDLTCEICGDKAIGYNYDVISCASCKVFFYRNANKPLESLRCLSPKSQCSIAYNVRRKCTRCRLERCFGVGMRKDLILSEQEKQRRKQIPKENEAKTLTHASSESNEIDHLLTNINEVDNNVDLNLLDNIVFDTLSIHDWLVIENVRSLFLTAFHKDGINQHSFDWPNPKSALIYWSYMANENALDFIKLFRRINEFEEFSADDRFMLIKYNIFPLYPILACLFYEEKHDCHRNIHNEEAEKSHELYSICFGSGDAHKAFHDVVHSLVNTTERDPTVLSLLMIVLMFYQGLSMNEDVPPLKDTLQVNRAQSHYVNVLWNYMVNKWGDIEAHKRFSQLLSIMFQMQIVAKGLRDYFCTQLVTSNAADEIAPLMQTVLHIS